jgi:hypothetical protein
VTGKTSSDSVDISTSNKAGKEKSSGSNSTVLKPKSGSSPSASSSVSSSLGGGNSGTIVGEVPSGMKRPAPSAHGESRVGVVSSMVGELHSSESPSAGDPKRKKMRKENSAV